MTVQDVSVRLLAGDPYSFVPGAKPYVPKIFSKCSHTDHGSVDLSIEPPIEIVNSDVEAQKINTYHPTAHMAQKNDQPIIAL